MLVVYQHLPHYRSEVFQELQGSQSIDWCFAADFESHDGSIPTIPPNQLQRFYHLKNRWVGRALWQSHLTGLLLRNKYSAVVFLGDVAFVSTWFGAALCRIRGSRVLFWTIGWQRRDHGLRRLVRLGFYRLADVLLLYGETGRQIGLAAGYPANRMAVVGNSKSTHVVTSSESDVPEDELPKGRSIVVTAVVRLKALKSLDLLIRAAGLLGSDGRDVVVMLVGAGPEAGELRRLAVTLGVDLRMFGPVYSGSALTRIYECTTVTVVPRNAGLTCIQSMAYGRPVITTDDPFKWAPESEAIQPGVTGGYYVDGSVSSLADAIDEWAGLMRERGPAVAADCRHEVALRWTPQAQAAAISVAVANHRPTGRWQARRGRS